MGHDFGDGFFDKLFKGKNTAEGQFHIIILGFVLAIHIPITVILIITIIIVIANWTVLFFISKISDVIQKSIKSQTFNIPGF